MKTKLPRYLRRFLPPDGYSDLATLLRDSVVETPVEEGIYFYNPVEKRFWCSFSNRSIPYPVQKLNLSKGRVLAYLENGLLTGMTGIRDCNYLAVETDVGFKWMTRSDSQSRRNLAMLEQVKINHPELNSRDGYFDEGCIHLKGDPGFLIVPGTKATVAVNPDTREVKCTYSGELLTPWFSERGEVSFKLNPRICDKVSIYLHRAIAFVTIGVPQRYRLDNETLAETIASLEVDHIDGDPSNNDRRNFQYLTKTENLIKKVDQGKCGRSVSSIWKSPNGEIVTFMSMSRAIRAIGTDMYRLVNVMFSWKHRVGEINGWILLSDRKIHPDEKYYEALEKTGIDRAELSYHTTGAAALQVVNGKFQVTISDSLSKLCSVLDLSYQKVDVGIRIRGPFSAQEDLIILPVRFLDFYTKSGLLEEYLKMPRYRNRRLVGKVDSATSREHVENDLHLRLPKYEAYFKTSENVK